MKHSVRLEYDGIVRWYPCDSYFDAITLEHALRVVYGPTTATIWKGTKQIS